MILQTMTREALEARARTNFARYRNKLWFHVDDVASVEAPCEGSITLELKEDAGPLAALRVVGGGVGVGLGGSEGGAYDIFNGKVGDGLLCQSCWISALSERICRHV